MLGGEVGYSIRFDDCCDKNSTRIKVNTQLHTHDQIFVTALVSF